MSHQQQRTRAFVYNQDQTAADTLAAHFWAAEFECWPFSRLDAMADSFASYPPHLTVLEALCEREAVQVVMLIAALCPHCRFIAFVNNQDGRLLSHAYHREENLEIFALSPTAEEIVRLAHGVRSQFA